MNNLQEQIRFDQMTIIILSFMLLTVLVFLVYQMKLYDKLEKKYMNEYRIGNITGAHVADMLFPIHKHAGNYLKFDLENSDEEYMNDPSIIVYEESDVIDILKSLGLPEPNWEKA